MWYICYKNKKMYKYFMYKKKTIIFNLRKTMHDNIMKEEKEAKKNAAAHETYNSASGGHEEEM